MSNNIATKLQAILAAKGDIKDAIESKGVTVGNAAFDEYASKIGQIPAPVVEAPENDVNFYDYDGFRVASYTIAEAKALTALPTPPTHEGLTFQEWNWTLNDIQTYDRQYIDIGANYIPTDGKTHIIANVIANDVLITLRGVGDATIDWGDETISTLSLGNSTVFSHTYASKGVYNISISGTQYGFISQANLSNWKNILIQEIRVGEKLTTNSPMQLGNLNSFSSNISIPKSATNTISLCITNSFVNSFNVQRNENVSIDTYQAFLGLYGRICFPRKIKEATNSYLFWTAYLTKLVLPELTTGTYNANIFTNANYSIISIPNIQFSGNVNFVSNKLRVIDIVSGWIPTTNLQFSASSFFSAESMVDFFTKLGTTTNAITLTFGTTNLDKLTADQKAIATNKGYTLA